MRQRRGMLLICVLVCLGVASTITGLTIQSGLRARKQMKRHWQLEQTLTLLDAGVRRAVARLREGNDAWDETWNVSDAFDKFAVARVSVKPTVDGPASPRNYRVVAELQTNDLTPSVTRRSRVIFLPESTQAPANSDTNPEQED